MRKDGDQECEEDNDLATLSTWTRNNTGISFLLMSTTGRTRFPDIVASRSSRMVVRAESVIVPTLKIGTTVNGAANLQP